MPGEAVPTTRAATSPDAKRGPSRPDSAALVDGLERIRSHVQERLERLETALRQRTERAPVDEGDLARRDDELRRRAAEIQQRAAELQQRQAEVDDLQRRTRAERERWEAERQALIEQLEHDRHLLGEAWERLEREKLEAPAPAPSSARPARDDRPAPAVIRPIIASDDENPMEQAILRQFQAVRRDVRRNANGHVAG